MQVKFIRQQRQLTHCQRLAVGVLLFLIVVILLPTLLSIWKASDATITIITDKELPIEFPIETTRGFPDGPLLLDCRISVKSGVGKFVTGSRETMNSYGFPPSTFTISSRKVVVERVDAKGNLLSREVSQANHVIYFGFKDDPSAPLGQLYFVRKE